MDGAAGRTQRPPCFISELDPASAAETPAAHAAGLWYDDAGLRLATHLAGLLDGLVQRLLHGGGELRDGILQARCLDLEAQRQHATRRQQLGLTAVKRG